MIYKAGGPLQLSKVMSEWEGGNVILSISSDHIGLMVADEDMGILGRQLQLIPVSNIASIPSENTEYPRKAIDTKNGVQTQWY